ncbi:hypothetical protein GCM10028815_34220 [Mariniluteicoccus flavus]
MAMPQGGHLQWSLDASDSLEDGHAIVSLDDVTHTFPVTLKRNLRPAWVPLLPALSTPRMVIADHVTPKVGSLLRAHGWNYLDTAGNASVRAPGMALEIQGRRPPRPSEIERRSDAPLFTRARLRALLPILSEPTKLNEPLRTIAEQSGVSVATAHSVVTQLRGEGYETMPDHNPQAQEHWRNLLISWVTSYATHARDGLLVGRFRTDTDLRSAIPAVAESGALISGETALSLLEYDLYTEIGEFYTHEPGKLIRALRLRPYPDGHVTIRRPFWAPEAEVGRPRPGVAPSVVVYADLVAAADPRVDQVRREFERRDPILRPYFC